MPKKSSQPPKATKSADPSAKQSARTQRAVNRQTVYYTIFLLAWVLLSMAASQYIVSLPMAMLLGEAANEPFWTAVYYFITYALVLVLVLLVPPRLYELRQKRFSTKSATKNATKATSVASTKTAQVNVPSNSSADNPLSPNPVEMGISTPPTFVDIGLAPIGYVVYNICASFLLNLMTIFPWFMLEQEQNVGFNAYITGFDRIIAMVAIVFVAPIAEELIMRGWLYGKLRRRLPIWLAILLVSLLFGLLHGQWNVATTVFVMSVVLCSMREVTGSIWSGMLLHILSNGIAFYQLYIAL